MIVFITKHWRTPVRLDLGHLHTTIVKSAVRAVLVQENSNFPVRVKRALTSYTLHNEKTNQVFEK